MKKALISLVLVLLTAVNAIASDNSFSDTPYFNWKALRLADAIKETKGNGARVIAVFTAPECGYCRKYEKTLEKVDNVTIYRFLMPLDPASMKRSIDLWCSGHDNDERLHHLLKAMHDRTARYSAVSCANPIAENVRFGKKYDIYMTPTTIGADGRLVQGYLPLANLERWLSGRGAFGP